MIGLPNIALPPNSHYSSSCVSTYSFQLQTEWKGCCQIENRQMIAISPSRFHFLNLYRCYYTDMSLSVIIREQDEYAKCPGIWVFCPVCLARNRLMVFQWLWSWCTGHHTDTFAIMTIDVYISRRICSFDSYFSINRHIHQNRIRLKTDRQTQERHLRLVD